MQTQEISYKEAFEKVEFKLNEKSGEAVPSLNRNYLEQLANVLDHAKEVKAKHLREEASFKEAYPKTYMLMKVQRMLKEKEG